MWLDKSMKMAVQKLPWSLLKEGCSMIGILENRGNSSEMLMDLVFSIEFVCILVNENKTSNNVQRWKRRDFHRRNVYKDH